MSCCNPIVQLFANVLTSTVMYSAGMRAAFGTQPRIDVWYFDPDTAEFYTDNGTPSSGTGVKFDGTSILIDHGGLASGYIKVS